MQTTSEPKLLTVEVKQVPVKPCLTITAKALTMPQVPEFLQGAYQKLYTYVGGKAVPGECFARFPAWNDDTFDIEAGVVVSGTIEPKDEIATDVLGGHQALYTLHKGPYEGVSQAYEALQDEMKKLSLKPAGAPYEVYLNDPSRVPQSDLLTEVYWPIG